MSISKDLLLELIKDKWKLEGLLLDRCKKREESYMREIKIIIKRFTTKWAKYRRAKDCK